MAVYVIMLGPPGAGKGTQAKRVVRELNMPHISTGDLFRAMQDQDTPLARKIRKILAEGRLVPDDITIEVLKERLAQMDCEDGAIVDGYPRTIPQAEALDRVLAKDDCQVDVVLYFDISEEEAVRRISGRRSCPECGRIYHMTYDPPANDELCDEDGSKLTLREDDQPEVVRDRYQRYQEKTAPLVTYYRKRDKLVEIDAKRPADAITPDVIDAIEAAKRKATSC